MKYLIVILFLISLISCNKETEKYTLDLTEFEELYNKMLTSEGMLFVYQSSRMAELRYNFKDYCEDDYNPNDFKVTYDTLFAQDYYIDETGFLYVKCGDNNDPIYSIDVHIEFKDGMKRSRCYFFYGLDKEYVDLSIKANIQQDIMDYYVTKKLKQ